MDRSRVLTILSLALAGAPFLGAQARPALARDVNFEQKLNAPVPLDLTFHDETGRTVPLRAYFGDKPVVLELVYFRCPNLCPMSMHATVMGLKHVPLQPGRDYNVVVVSFDPSDTPAMATEKKAFYAEEFGKPGFNEGWHFLTGSQENVSRLGSAVGFGYRYDQATHQFVHASGIMVATPDGKMSRYFYGINYAPADLRMALVEASQHKIGSPVDAILLFCFHYDVYQGKYTLVILNILKIFAAITLLVLGGLVYLLMRNDKKKTARPAWKEVRHGG